MVLVPANLIQDFRYSLRLIKRSKGLAIGVVISLALGIGATASIFSIVDSLEFRPLPVSETGRVVHIRNLISASSDADFSHPEYQDFVNRSRSFIGIVTYQHTIIGLAANATDQPRVTLAMLVSGNFFSTLQVKLAAGRGFLPEEDSVPGRDAVAVISHTAWRRDFAGAKDVVGRTIAINGHTFTIIGVAPEQFLGIAPVIEPQIYIPRMMIRQADPSDQDTLNNRSVRNTAMLARLKPGVTIEQATEDVQRIASQSELEHPGTKKEMHPVVLTQFAYRRLDRPGQLSFAVLLFGVAFLVLAIACVNVSNLLLSTIPARTREMAIRAAMGAARTRLLGQLLLENVILSGVGTLAGLAVASWCAGFLSSLRIGSSDLSLHLQTRVDERVVIFAFGVGLVSALMSAAIPAWRCSRNDLNSLMKFSDLRNRPHHTWGRQILAGAQVAIAALVLVFSGLFVRDLQIAATQNPGFLVDHLLTMSLNPSIAGYDIEKSRAFYSELVERLRAMPGIKSAAIAQDKPFGISGGSTDLTVEGYEMLPNQQSVAIRSWLVGNGYFETLHIPILRGRPFDRRDGASAPRTVIVNETMAQRYWPNRDPIGARIEIKGEGGGPAEVIAIARNAKYGGMNEQPLPFLYRSYDQSNVTGAALLVETEGPPESLISAIRMQVRDIAPNMPIFDIRTMQDAFRETGLFESRLMAQIVTTVGAVGLVLAVLGLYGVIAYSVAQRTYEIGIRMAVGASPWLVLRMVLLQGLRSNAIAAAIGIGLAFELSGTITVFLSYVNPTDPSIYVFVLLLLLVVTGAALYVPARRASMVDPNVTLRS
jgi:predicted permease